MIEIKKNKLYYNGHYGKTALKLIRKEYSNKDIEYAEYLYNYIVTNK